MNVLTWPLEGDHRLHMPLRRLCAAASEIEAVTRSTAGGIGRAIADTPAEPSR